MNGPGQHANNRNTWPFPVLMAMMVVGGLAALAAAAQPGTAILAVSTAGAFVFNGLIRALPFGATITERALIRAAYWLPLVIPVLCLPGLRAGLTSGLPDLPALALGGLVGAALSFVFLWPSRQLFLDRDLREIVVPRQSAANLALSVQSMAGAAVFEELFFRYAVFALIPDIGTALFLSVVLFVLSHYSLPWASRDFRPRDYANQMLAGVALGLLYLVTGSLGACILAHITFNIARLGPLILRNLASSRSPHELHDT
ncbi:MAG: CPBP family intramembrane metalloprotease [Paracoccus sp. (in: a-proteobacteria)]|nr:CPBP family intramembrane metalloprotease [Paracoccus sp. (in: a-proteobacteria)]